MPAPDSHSEYNQPVVDLASGKSAPELRRQTCNPDLPAPTRYNFLTATQRDRLCAGQASKDPAKPNEIVATSRRTKLNATSRYVCNSAHLSFGDSGRLVHTIQPGSTVDLRSIECDVRQASIYR